MIKIGVYGLGRFGSFWAGLLSTKFEVYGYTRSSQRPTPKGVVRVNSLEDLAEVDVLYLCTSISSMEETARSLIPVLKSNTLIVDTCSVKVEPLKTLERLLGDTNPIMGTHPMFGPDSAKEGVKGLPVVLTPVTNSEKDLAYWKDVFAEMGMRVYIMTPEEHDQQAAYTQGITHFIGRVLDELSLESSPIGTYGYQRLLEIRQQTCNDPWQLFVDLQHYNPYTYDMRQDLKKAMNKIMKELHHS
ncbi:prephenate dehydrogenase/arogenate dehydrogenase family protein [Spirochaeta cellobiosiphila]|uniref:prephenate dehydrogenase/arogenate dehydrogenase family protein n=1 Tax=Spirochaeta cellobiosiphila TaxID=504483 RepID=UPI00040983AF|nr:prephenate dehydrogenase/arogenate dehydrogenase family protein [Spirochaeta cellobiosiphila]